MLLLKNVLKDYGKAVDYIEAHGLNATIVRLMGLTKGDLNTAFKIVHECGTFVRRMRTKSPLSAKIIVQLYNLLYTYFMYEFSYK